MLLMVILVGLGIFHLHTRGQATISRGIGNQTLPPPFKKAVDDIIRKALVVERNRNMQVYATNGSIFASADTVTGTQSNKIVELLVKTGIKK